jgi:hypothetical protein
MVTSLQNPAGHLLSVQHSLSSIMIVIHTHTHTHTHIHTHTHTHTHIAWPKKGGSNFINAVRVIKKV